MQRPVSYHFLIRVKFYVLNRYKARSKEPTAFLRLMCAKRRVSKVVLRFSKSFMTARPHENPKLFDTLITKRITFCAFFIMPSMTNLLEKLLVHSEGTTTFCG